MSTEVNSAGPGGAATGNVDSIVLEEEIDPNYVPTESEVVEYAKWLGMDLDKDNDLFWVAKEGLMAPLPKNWKPCKTKDTEDIYYFNFASGESTWDHPCDGYYKKLFEEEKKKKELTAKDKADENRTQAKADVEKLLGKDEKKKKKKKSAVSEISSLSSPTGKGKKSTSSSSVTSKALPKPSALGPIGGSKPLEKEKAALPGISQHGPLRASTNSKSEISLLTTSDGTGSSIKEGKDGKTQPMEALDSPRDAGSSSGTGSTKRSKMSMRLSSVVATSDELQLDSTPKKDSEPYSKPEVKEAKEEAKAASRSSPTRTTSRTADAVEQSKSKIAKTVKDLSASAPGRISPQKKTKPHTSTDAATLEAEAKDTSRAREELSSSSKPVPVSVVSAVSASQSKSNMLSSSLSVSSDSFTSEREIDKKALQLEKDLNKKSIAFDNLHLELQDAERRVSRANQRQGVAEETETALQRKLEDAKKHSTILQKSIEQLEKENRDLRSVLQKRRDDVDDIMDKDEHKAEVIDSLKEEVKMNASSERRAVEMQTSLREELTTQSNFYETKLRSSDLIVTGLKEDLERSKKMSETAKAEEAAVASKHTEELKNMTTAMDSLKEELEAATSKLKSVPTVEVVKEVVKEVPVEVIKEVVTVKDSPEAMEEVNKLNKNVIRLTHELNKEKAAVEDANMRSRRFEHMSSSWEADCKDKDVRIVSARTRSNELEDKCTELESHIRKLTSQAKMQTVELEAATAGADTSLKLQKELTSKGLALSAMQDAVAEGEKKIATFTTEIVGLKIKIVELEQRETTMPTMVTDVASTSTAEYEEAKKTLLQKDADIATLNADVAKLTQRADVLVEKNNIVEAELNSLRVLHSALKSSHTNAESSFDGITEEATMWKQKAELLSNELNQLRASNDLGHAEEVRQLGETREELHQLKMAAIKTEETARTLRAEKDYAKEEQRVLRNQLNSLTDKCRDMEDNLQKARQETLSTSTECSKLQYSLTTEKRDREAQMQVISEQTNTIARLKANLREGALPPPMPAVPPVEALAAASIENNRGFIDLSVKVGEQSSAISTLEKKLGDAMDTIIRLKQNATRNATSENAQAIDVEDLDKSTLIKEMMLDFVQRRKPLAKDEAAAGVAASDKQQQSSVSRGVDYWKALLQKEAKFVTDARRVMKEEKADIRWEQQLLLKRREVWKSEGHNRSSGTQQILNQQTVNLNTAVEQARHTDEWLNDRDRKLSSLQQLIDSPGSVAMDMQIDKLAVELDNDMLRLTPGYHLQGGVAGGARIIPTNQLFYQQQQTGQQSTFFPPYQQLGGRNTYLDARAENGPNRPVLRSSTAENVPLNGYVADRQKARKVASDVQKMAQDRGMVKDAYESHIGWLAGMHKDINSFRPEGSTSPERNEKRYSGRAFIDAVVQEKFEL